MPEVVRSLQIPAPPSVVWQWLSTEDGLRRWMSPEIEIDVRVGGAYRMPGGDGETWISGVVLEMVPEGRLVLSWLEEDSGWVHPGRLVITLEPVAGGTRVGLVHDGFAGIGKPGWEKTAEAYERGADKHQVLRRLADAVTAAGV
ncbi:SRPBCC domain-containing protein [Actinoplanes sp. LDG1-06]|uniref:SRPBCC domain-containing protein n=1 Tax=Paractinoplanes ovalisporus TaxID=2810368 RepID=A0ABS2A8Y1_9ACTN|nr:SRPBCC domain-containing protein [Actinoplanes ovalisporus]MBM2615773.1 SRPBCC domain-containing protein [Actinoplanes ovalisporus]